MHSFVRKLLRMGEISEEAAAATLVLIPKETKPSSMRGFGPLS